MLGTEKVLLKDKYVRYFKAAYLSEKQWVAVIYSVGRFGGVFVGYRVLQISTKHFFSFPVMVFDTNTREGTPPAGLKHARQKHLLLLFKNCETCLFR